MTYRIYGRPSSPGRTGGAPGEYDTFNPFYQPRFHDCYLYGATFGTGQGVLWTPSAYLTGPRVVAGNYPVTYSPGITLAFEESASNPKPYSDLQKCGITMWYKIKNEASGPLDAQTVREAKGPTGAFKGSTASLGNTFGITSGCAFCIGMNMDKGSTVFGDTGYNGRYNFYLVNRDPANLGRHSDIVWRIQYQIGLTYPTSNLPLPNNTYIISNPVITDPVNTMTINSNVYTFRGSTADVDPTRGFSLAIDYSMMTGPTGADNIDSTTDELTPDYIFSVGLT
jgi:hypothetical protein